MFVYTVHKSICRLRRIALKEFKDFDEKVRTTLFNLFVKIKENKYLRYKEWKHIISYTDIHNIQTRRFPLTKNVLRQSQTLQIS